MSSVMQKIGGTSKCASAAGHFDGHAEALKGYMGHCPMEDVQGYTGSHWTPPSGNCSLCIAPAAARVTGKTTTMGKYTLFAGHFDGHSNALVQCHAHCLIEVVQGYDGSHWSPPLGEYCGQ